MNNKSDTSAAAAASPVDNADFATLPLSAAQVANLQAMGFRTMTQIQAKALPLVLVGKDVLGQAKTGSGKTAAFGLGVLQSVAPKQFKVQALVLCPTRELAEQVGKAIRRLAQATPNVKLVTLCGGKPIGPQKQSLHHGAHIVVGTPGRVLDHLRKRSLQLAELKVLVLDEADRMLDMGFADDMEAIVTQAPKQRQTLLFSATFPAAITAMSRSMQTAPVRVSADVEHAQGVIEQLFYEVRKDQRDDTLLGLLEHYQPGSAVVFCQTKVQCARVSEFLNAHGVEAVALHGDLDQRRRDLQLTLFTNGSTSVLVATDVAARGLDIKALPMVINYELPHDPQVYVHRTGRTGRAGEQGLAMSLINEAQRPRMLAIEEYVGQPCLQDVPASLDRQSGYQLRAQMGTLQIEGGRKAKIRPGDVLGALTGDAGLQGSQIGKIDIQDHYAYVAIERTAVRTALNYFSNGKLKGRSVRARRVS